MSGPGPGTVEDAVAGAADWPVPHAAAAVLWTVPGVPPAGGGPVTWGAVDRVQPWASVTKLLTALAVLVAVEEGTVDLDQPAGPPGATVRHLLAHASGLGPTGRVLTTPGRRRIYSNAGYDLLGDTVAAGAGMPFAVYVAEGVLQPLGMAATAFAEGASPAAGASGPLTDLLRLAAEFLAPRLVAPSTLATATATAFPGLAGVVPGVGRFDPCDWGLGPERRDGKVPHWTGTANGPNTFGHFGRSGSFLWVDPAAGCAAAGLTGRQFGPWALVHWPRWSDAVLRAAAAARAGDTAR